MAKKPKRTKRNKKAKPSSSLLIVVLFGFMAVVTKIIKGLIALLAWLVARIYGQARGNPLAFVGLSLFFVIFAVVAMNALFQPSQGERPDGEKRQTENSNPQWLIMQHQLAEIGLYKGEIDGVSGPQTWAAVENWQKLRLALELGKQSQSHIQNQINEKDEDAVAKIIRDLVID